MIEVDLRRYLSSGIVYGEERALTSEINLPPPRSRAMSAAEVKATLGRLLFHLRRDGEALARTGSLPAPFRVRAPGVGEEQRLGLLDAIDCPGAQFVARVTTRSGPLSLVTASLAGVHLSSARDDVSGALACGARARREAVYVTWKSADQLVALEFLPRDFQPGR